jgi:hypothetical protein
MRRDGGTCVVPGCRQGVFVDIHHLKPRADGGDHDPDMLAVLCAAHRRALRSLEFRETDVRRVLERVGSEARAGEWSVVEILRRAIPSLAP